MIPISSASQTAAPGDSLTFIVEARQKLNSKPKRRDTIQFALFEDEPDSSKLSVDSAETDKDGRAQVTLTFGKNAEGEYIIDAYRDEDVTAYIWFTITVSQPMAAAPSIVQGGSKDTALLANYPNPFNPETWMPYRLAEDASVTITIYDIRGKVVRTFDLGHQRAGIYQNRSRAVYWDGRNQFGEQVATGIYFYALTTDHFSATRSMLILK